MRRKRLKGNVKSTTEGNYGWMATERKQGDAEQQSVAENLVAILDLRGAGMSKNAKPRKAYKPRALINPIRAARALAGKLLPSEIAQMMDPVHECFDLLRQGKWMNSHFSHMANVFNVAQALTGPGFNLLNDHVGKFDAAQQVLADLAERRVQGKGWTCYANELTIMATAIEFYGYQIDFVSSGELLRATMHVDNVIKGARSGSPGKGHIHTVLPAEEMA